MLNLGSRLRRSQNGPQLTKKHLLEYESRGFTVVRGLIASNRAMSLAEEALKLSESPSPFAVIHRDQGDMGEFRVDIDIHRRSKNFRQLAFGSEMLITASHFIGAQKFHFFYDQLFVKLSKTSTRTQWHQDLPFWPLVGDGIPSLWLALTHTDSTNSAVQYIEGSHKWPILFAPVNAEERDRATEAGLQVCPDFHKGTDPSNRICSHTLFPGDAVVHHPLVIHGSGPNEGKEPRIAVSFRYMSGDAMWYPRHDTMTFPAASHLISGTRMSEQTVFHQCSLGNFRPISHSCCTK